MGDDRLRLSADTVGSPRASTPGPSSAREEELEKEKEESPRSHGSLRGSKKEKDAGHFSDARLKAVLTEREIRLTIEVLPVAFENYGRILRLATIQR